MRLIKEIRKYGMDPGSVNLANCGIVLNGLKYNEDRTMEIPDFYPTNMEVWNLKTGTAIRNSSPNGGKFEKYSIPLLDLNTTRENNLDTWIARLNHFIASSSWMFKYYNPYDSDYKESNHKNYSPEYLKDLTLPSITVENQMDHIVNKKKNPYGKPKFDMFRISNEFATSIHMCDVINGRKERNKAIHLSYRDTCKGSLKYGMRNDGSREYEERKGDSVIITLELFKILGLTQWIVFLESVKKSGQKIDDLCDALLLALQAAINEYELNLKLNKKNPSSTNQLPIISLSKEQYNQTMNLIPSSLRKIPTGSINTDIFPKLLSDEPLDENNNVIKKRSLSEATFGEDTFFDSYDELLSKSTKAIDKDNVDDNEPVKKKRKVTVRKKNDTTVVIDTVVKKPRKPRTPKRKLDDSIDTDTAKPKQKRVYNKKPKIDVTSKKKEQPSKLSSYITKQKSSTLLTITDSTSSIIDDIEDDDSS